MAYKGASWIPGYMNIQVEGELSGVLAIFPIHSKDKTLSTY